MPGWQCLQEGENRSGEVANEDGNDIEHVCKVHVRLSSEHEMN